MARPVIYESFKVLMESAVLPQQAHNPTHIRLYKLNALVHFRQITKSVEIGFKPLDRRDTGVPLAHLVLDLDVSQYVGTNAVSR